MHYCRLYLFLEGNDDERFFNTILLSEFERNFTEIKIWKYANKTDTQRKRFIDTISNVDEWYYHCFRDFDSNTCITRKKMKVVEKFNSINSQNIFIVIEEIESWYLAGIDNDFLRSINSPNLMQQRSEYITEEIFDQLIPKDMPRIQFMRLILNNYDLERALRNNSSLNYLFEKLFQS